MMRMVRRLGLAAGMVLGALCLAPVGAMAEINVPADIPPLPADSDFPPGVGAEVFPPAFGGTKGFHVSEIKAGSGVYWITDGNYHSMAIVHRDGVMVVDAPQPLPFAVPGPFGAIPSNMPVLDALEEIAPGKRVTHLIYSHAHTDHIGGASDIVDAFPHARIVGHLETWRTLKTVKDPRRPAPNTIFFKKRRLNVGGQKVELHYFGNTHQAGNAFIWLPRHKILMAVDIVYPGWVPFRRLALSENIRGWFKGHDAIESFDFDFLVGGHLTRLGTKADVALAKEYNADVRREVDAVYTDFNVFFQAVGAIDSVFGANFAFATQSKWALFSAFYDASTMGCADFLDAKYNNDGSPPPAGHSKKPLAGGETFNFSNCEAYFQALRLGDIEAP